MRFFGRSWAFFVFLSTLWLAQSPAIATTLPCTVDSAGSHHYLAGDLDADHQADRVSFRFSGTHSSIEVHLSSNRQRVHLFVPFRGETGYQLIAYDVDHDRRDDLILTGDSSIVPVALWLNKGNGLFVRKSGMLAPLFGSGFRVRLHRGTSRADSPAVISSNGSPKAFQIDRNIYVHFETLALNGHSDNSGRSSADQVYSSPRSPPCI